jgi:hypothetical protein
VGRVDAHQAHEHHGGRSGQGDPVLYGVLGFKKKHDIPVGEYRWITVTSPEGPDDVELALEPNANPAGKTFQEAMFKQGIPLAAFEVSDIKGEFARLTARASHSCDHQRRPARSRFAVFADTCGNLIQLYQPS